MGVKRIIKSLIGRVRILLSGVHGEGSVYIGSRFKVVNGANVRLGHGVSIRPDVDIFAEGLIKIGARSDIGSRNRISGTVTIEDAVLVGPDNYISSVDHDYSDISRPILDCGGRCGRKNGHSEVLIGEGSWIGTHCAIIGDVHIGKHCVVGANSVVTKDVPDYCVVCGAPAKVVKRYDFDLGKWLSTGLCD